MPRLEPIPSLPGRAGSRRARGMRVSSSLAEINVVPLVDVMLVLLIIFMVAAPMMQQGFPVNLPQTRKSQPLNTEPVTVTVPSSFRRDGKVRIGGESVGLNVLDERVRQALSGRLKREVMLAGDAEITLQDLMTVMAQLKAGGVEMVGLQSQPVKSERRP
jgi:biopolymer transport protein ExbD